MVFHFMNQNKCSKVVSFSHNSKLIKSWGLVANMGLCCSSFSLWDLEMIWEFWPRNPEYIVRGGWPLPAWAGWERNCTIVWCNPPISSCCDVIEHHCTIVWCNPLISSCYDVIILLRFHHGVMSSYYFTIPVMSSWYESIGSRGFLILCSLSLL